MGYQKVHVLVISTENFVKIRIKSSPYMYNMYLYMYIYTLPNFKQVLTSRRRVIHTQATSYMYICNVYMTSNIHVYI